MRMLRFAPIVLGVIAAACGGAPPSPVTPTSSAPTDVATDAPTPTAISSPCTIGFDGLQVNGAPFDRHSACGLAVTAANAPWQVSTTYGSPAPFIQFQADGGTTVTGDVTLQAAAGSFTFASVDIYSSTTKIPYEITGSAHGAVVFTLQAVQGNTFGRFATVTNPHASAAIDTLRLRLTNPAAPCCRNPVGLDNIHVGR